MDTSHWSITIYYIKDILITTVPNKDLGEWNEQTKN